MNKININDAGQIDINCHALIEASAGTGKTYTITNLVARIILEKNIPLDSIVIVTFTEKATGELREKIRNHFIKLLNEKNNKKISDVIENIDKLFISTIHGFCNKILSEYSFENRGAFDSELVNDESIIDRVLQSVVRSDWKDYYKDFLQPVVELSDFSEKPDDFFKTIKKVALHYKPYNNDKIIPEPLNIDIIKDTVKALKDKFRSIQKITGDINNYLDHRIIREYEKLDINSKSRVTRIKKILIPLFELIKNIDKNFYNRLNRFINISIKTSSVNINDDKYLLLVKKAKNKTPAYDLSNSEIYNIAILLNEALGLFLKLKNELSSFTVKMLVERLKKYKAENDLISFDDMLSNLNKAIKDSPDFLKILQDRFKYALIDEFQDTDRAQWEIFKNIFLDCEENRLFIIGDPKQSIYKFRDADINTYFTAKKSILETYNGKLYFLNTCYRSSKQLIADLNNFFIHGEWFKDDSTIEYEQINHANDNLLSYIKMNDKRDDSGILIFKLKSESKANAMIELAKIIADEIYYLLNNKTNIRLKIKNNEERSLKNNDICILVGKKIDAERIQKYLNLKKIKSIYYKKPGLYKTDEAMNIHYAIDYLANPDDINTYKKLLLSDFFKIDLSKIDSFLEIEESNPIKTLISKWIFFTKKHEWHLLFHSMLYETGLLYRISAGESTRITDSERCITNYKHITEKLAEIASRKKLDIFDLNMYYNNLINENINIDINENLQRLETEEEKVVIMTIHASKGLEYPVIFDYSILLNDTPKSYARFHENDRITYDFTMNLCNKEKNIQEDKDESNRLKYVAFTRAMVKLYIPYFNPTNSKSKSNTIELIKKSIDQNSYTVIEMEDQEIETENTSEKFVNTVINNYNFDNIFKKIDKKSFINKRLTLQSFSSISKFNKSNEVINLERSIIFESEKEHDEAENITEHNESNELPGGTNVGLMFHKIFEEIDFTIVKNYKNKNFKNLAEDKSIIQLVEQCFNIYMRVYIEKNEEKEAYLSEIYKIIFNTLNTPIIGDFCLSDLTRGEKLHEVEFYYPVELVLKKDNVSLNAFINGFIDMVFKLNEKYYLVDWKSNLISGGYSGELFSNTVKEHYKLQYDIYYYAFIKWMQKRIKDFNYEKHFGGIFYIYLRGIGNNSNDKNSGVYNIYYGKEMIDEINRTINQLILDMNEID